MPTNREGRNHAFPPGSAQEASGSRDQTRQFPADLVARLDLTAIPTGERTIPQGLGHLTPNYHQPASTLKTISGNAHPNNLVMTNLTPGTGLENRSQASWRLERVVATSPLFINHR
ncbi:hypothetical protein RND81_03G019000 [Saponaria officinalis]|uniref:Uncharacterized protein n=1 Tax=Saponaria officinalis TaxID=3572 RepID=A0AAW1M3W9_SAPOF